MARLSIMGVLPVCLLLPTALALPQFWPHGYHEKPYPTLTISSSDGVYPTGISGTTGTGSGIATGTGTDTAYYPTATGSAYIIKREPDHPFGYPPPYKPSVSSGIVPTGFPTASATYIPTGTAPSASATGTSVPHPSYIPSEQDVASARESHRQHFEGPRKQNVKPYYPYVPSQSYDGGAIGPTATAPTGATGTGVVSWPMPTGTSVVPLPIPTGASSSFAVPLPSGSGGCGYLTASI